MARRLVIALFSLLPLTAAAQFNVDRLVMSGRSALYYEDYVLAIQHFNRAIMSKPYLYEPWFYRGVAKYYLDDFAGAESDCSEAIKLNPYITGIYELRGLCRIKVKKYEEAITDYDRALKDEPSAQNFWVNRMLCRVELKDYERAQLDLDTIIQKWSNFARAYSIKAGICLIQKDTLEAAKWLDHVNQLDPYDWEAWLTRANISLSRNQWLDADAQLSEVIHLKPKMVACYLNRALVRLNINNLRGAMADYDKTIELDPDNFLAHYNRGILRVQVGDDNRAIEDFDYVVRMEPNNIMALYNRAVLLHKTGNLRRAIQDYSRIIEEFPNFWTGLQARAECYRRLGMTQQAELDEFRIFKAQMDKHIGIQPRWTRAKVLQTRKRSEIDFSKYNQIVVEDEKEEELPAITEQEYASVYRGKVQHRKLEVDNMPLYHLSYIRYNNVVKAYQVFVATVDSFNQKARPLHTVYVNCNPNSLTEQQGKAVFAAADTLTETLLATTDMTTTKNLLLQRAVAHTVVQNYQDAIDDLNTCLEIDPNFSLALWQRGVCSAMQNEFNQARGNDSKLKAASAIYDLDKAAALAPDNPYIYYDRGTLHLAREEYDLAIEDFTQCLKLNANVSEAYYNRGLALAKSGKRQEGVVDLSKAGELGLYSAYGMIKKYSD
ncbi:MAG: tetratricopeptide repeat protein [Prevotella sp.]|nr:tetratricopeptide repeat protein [Prevotella sp.]